MKSRTYTATALGGLMLDLRVSFGAVRVVVEDCDHAEVTLTGPDADVIDHTRFAEAYSRLTVHVPDPPALHLGGTVHMSGGNVGMVAGVVYGGMVMYGNGGQAAGMVVGGVGSAGITVDVRLPLHSSLSAKTVAASVVVSGALVTASVDTTSGAIALDTVGGPELESVSGDISVANLAGIGFIETVSGDIDAHAERPCDLNARSVSGDIRTTGPIRLAAHTVSGRVRTY
ncbi:DUF4097 family beta strand repeat-containing protein [Dactylosporangium sp. McL0621]|uniref:DUF4097 family beta strand repeat-containing protein n=1 Tax=Dactylosporangium sp. McL0621 TaxID=3415678 RepID=UPI003CF4D7D7